MRFCVLHLHYKPITNGLRKEYKKTTKVLLFMKAKKTSPKSIRFNIKNFEIAMTKGNFESAQEMVDFLLNEYANSNKIIENIILKEPIKEKIKSASQQIEDKIKKEEEKIRNTNTDLNKYDYHQEAFSKNTPF